MNERVLEEKAKEGVGRGEWKKWKGMWRGFVGSIEMSVSEWQCSFRQLMPHIKGRDPQTNH